MKKLSFFLAALLVSAAPVQANEELDDKFIKFVEPCYTSDKRLEACFAMGTFQSLVSSFSLICNLLDDKDISEVGMINSVGRLGERLEQPLTKKDKLAWNIAVRNIRGFHPKCPIRPVRY